MSRDAGVELAGCGVKPQGKAYYVRMCWHSCGTSEHEKPSMSASYNIINIVYFVARTVLLTVTSVIRRYYVEESIRSPMSSVYYWIAVSNSDFKILNYNSSGKFVYAILMKYHKG